MKAKNGYTLCRVGRMGRTHRIFSQKPEDMNITSCKDVLFYIPAGSKTCPECSAGSYQDNTGRTACKLCPVGKYQSNTGQSGCIACEAGTYQSTTGRNSFFCQSSKLDYRKVLF